MPALHFAFSEALALLLAVNAARRINGTDSNELSAALLRLESLFPTELIPHLRKVVSKSAHLSARGRDSQHILKLLHFASIEQRKVRISYCTSSRGGVVNERTVHPYCLVPYGRSWQLIAYCELRGEVRIFKVVRISDAQIFNASYSIPRTFSLEDYLGMAWGFIRGENGEAEDVLLHFNAEAGRWVAEEFWHRTQKTEVLEDGSIHFTVRIPVTPDFVNWILYYGPRVQVLEPDWLRARVAELHQKAARMNAQPNSAGS
jgi:predicted DNA-binding transcriptional regulator YafY